MFPFWGTPNIQGLKAKRDISALNKAVSYRYQKDDEVRKQAAIALGELGDVSSVEPLINALDDPTYWVVKYVAQALGKIGDARAINPLLGKWSRLADRDALEEIKQALLLIGRTAPDVFLKILQEKKYGIEIASQVMGQRKDVRAVESLIAILDDESYAGLEHVVIASIKALGEIGDPRAVESLMSLHARRNESIRYEVIKALGKIGDARAAEILVLHMGVDPDSEVRDVASEALGRLEVNDISKDQLLISEVWKGNLKRVGELLELGANVEAKQTRNGETALMVAAIKGSTEIVRLLLEKGANPNAKDKFGNPVWHGAFVNLNETKEDGITYILHPKNFREGVELLLNYGADVNSQDRYGQTGLNSASFRGQTEIVRLLLERGADINIKDEDGRTPLVVARKNNHTEIIKLLEGR